MWKDSIERDDLEHMKQDKTYLFEEMSIPRAVMELSIPTVLGTLVMMLYNLADTYFVGMLNQPVENAAVTLAAPLLLSFNAVSNLFGVGASSMMSRALGRKDYDTVRGAASFSFYCAIACSVLLSLAYTTFQSGFLAVLGADPVTTKATANYLFWTVTCGACPAILNVVLSNMVRSEGYSMHASLGVMSGCLLNIVMDPFFILPQFLGMGVAGAGLATFLSNTMACLYFFVLLFFRRESTYVCLNPKRFFVHKAAILSIFGVGIPASIQNLLNVTGMTILNNFTSAYGADAVAAMGISYKVNMLPMYVCMGIGQGIMPLVSYNYASGNRKRMKDSILFVTKIMAVFAVTLMAVYFIWSGEITRLFMENKSIIAYGTRFLRLMSISIPFLATDFMAVGIFQAIGKGSYSLVFAILRKVVLEIPALYILNYFFPLYGLAFAQSSAEIVLAVAAVVVMSRILKEDTAMHS